MVKHDKLQSECFLWLHNTFPETRKLIHANINSHPKWNQIDMQILKGIGLVKGILDLEFYWNGSLYIFDIKTGSDRLKKDQIETIEAIRKHGGDGFEIRSIDEFKKIIYEIIQKPMAST